MKRQFNTFRGGVVRKRKSNSRALENYDEKNKEKFTGSHTEVNPSFYISGVPSEVFEIPATLSAIIHVFIL